MEVRERIIAGESVENAIENVTEELEEVIHIGDATVRSAWKKLRRIVPNLPDDLFPLPRQYLKADWSAKKGRK